MEDKNTIPKFLKQNIPLFPNMVLKKLKEIRDQ